jgi:hypothetical protein
MRSTYPLKTVLLARNAQRAPAVHPDATMGQPNGNPYTKPAMVLAVEYPTMGGKEVTKTSINARIHPPGRARHASAFGSSHLKKT